MAQVLAVVGMGMQLIGGLQQASAIRAAGKAQQAEFEYRAKQAKQAAGQERASGQRASIEQARRLRLAQSEAIASGAASGRTGDGSFLNIMSALESEGQYAKDFALFESEDRAVGLEQQSDMLKYEGENARIAAKTEARNKTIGTLANTAMSAGSLFSKYGGTGNETISWADGTTGTYRNTGRRFA